jgi:phosphoglycolate phosphatase
MVMEPTKRSFYDSFLILNQKTVFWKFETLNLGLRMPTRKNPPKIDTVIFDFDGTLMDTRAATMETLRRTLAHLEIEPAESPPAGHLHALTVGDMLRAVGVSNERLLKRACKEFARRYRADASVCSRVFPGVIQTLQTLRHLGFRMAVATNEFRRNFDRLMREFGLDVFFQTTVCADEVVSAKPDPEMAVTVLRQLGSRPITALMVGDSPLDIQMGRSAGLMTCAVTHGATPGRALVESAPDFIIDAFQELIGLLELPSGRAVKRRL